MSTLLFYLFSGTHYILRGGASGLGADCGSFYIRARYAASIATWSSGAALSFNLYFHL